MNLNYTDLAHFINQLSQATVHYGFSDQDSQTLSTQLNSLYNVRCAPAITQNPTEGPQLLSLCQASNCPLAEPNPDCAAYVNLTASGAASSAVSATQTSTPTSMSTASPAASPSPSARARKLSAGAIAGIAIGAVVVLLLLAGATIVWLRRRKSDEEEEGYAPTYTSPSIGVKDDMRFSAVPTMAEMESPRAFDRPEMTYGNPVEIGEHEQRAEELWGRMGQR